MAMDNSSLIREISNHLQNGIKNAYTQPLLDIARKAIAEDTSNQEQQHELISLAKKLEELLNAPPAMGPLGSSARPF